MQSNQLGDGYLNKGNPYHAGVPLKGPLRNRDTHRYGLFRADLHILVRKKSIKADAEIEEHRHQSDGLCHYHGNNYIGIRLSVFLLDLNKKSIREVLLIRGSFFPASGHDLSKLVLCRDEII